MGSDSFANGMEICCKASSGKSVAAFPDVCMTPPTAPPTPPGVPLPYPNTGMASDCTDGSKTVKIKGKEVLLKNKSYFKKSSGDEAGSAPKKGVVTSVNTGKVYFSSWSMDVKVEGENVVRHLDMTTHNHASMPGATPPWPFMASMAIDDMGQTDDPCGKDKEKEEQACGGKSRTEQCEDSDCRAAQACKLVAKGNDKKDCCADANTGHHLIEDHWIRDASGGLLSDFAGLAAKNAAGTRYLKPGGPYNGAPTVCADGDRFSERHGTLHGTSGVVEDLLIGKPLTYGAGKGIAIVAHDNAFPESECDPGCIDAQLDDFYGPGNDRPLRSPHRAQALTTEQRSAARARFKLT